MKIRSELIRLHEVSCQRFPNPLAEHINLVICRGELTGMIAPDDSMKQMLLELLIGKQKPAGGRRLLYESEKEGMFGCIVNGKKLFEDMTITDNLLWMRHTRQKLIWSERKAEQRALEILKKYGFQKEPGIKVRCLSLAERYMLEVIKAIEIFGVRLLVIDNIHLIGREEDQERILELTSKFRSFGGAVVLCSILRLPILKKASRIYLLQEGRPIRTLFAGTHHTYRTHTDLFLSDYLQYTAGALMTEKKWDSQSSGYTLRLGMPGEEAAEYDLQIQGALGLYVPQAFQDQHAEAMLALGKWSIHYAGKAVPIKKLSDLVRHNIGYFPKQTEELLFYRLNLQENVEIFAYQKLCRFPGILSSRLEAYFMEHCIAADKQTKEASDLSHAKHNVVLQTAISRYQQRKWDLLLVHAPIFIYDSVEYHLMQNFIADLMNQGTAVVIISNDRRLLSRFSYQVACPDFLPVV